MTLIDALIDAGDYLERHSLANPLKKRDKREPGRKLKEESELELIRFFTRRFRRQKIAIRERLVLYAPDRKATLPIDIEDLLEDPEDEAELIRLLTKMVKNGIRIFGMSAPIGIDYTAPNQRAAAWAARYAGELIKGIDKTTLDIVKNWVEFFIDNSGFTIGDLIDRLPFDLVRSEMIAATEVTRAYAQADREAGLEIQAEFPDVPVVKTWQTNSDDLVCEICEPLNGEEVGLNEMFTTPDGIEIEQPPAHPNCRCWTITTTRIT